MEWTHPLLNTASKSQNGDDFQSFKLKMEGPMNKVTVLGIDLAKNVFQLHGVDEKGTPILKRKLTRQKMIETIAQLEPCTIVMEACSGASYWCRKFSAYGHTPKLISPQFVKPFVKTNKNDRNDAEAICEAASRPTMRFVAPNTVEQQDIQCLHRIRSRLIQERTALVNQTRGLLAEYGITVSQGIRKLRGSLADILEDAENELTNAGRALFCELHTELLEKDQKIAIYDKKLEAVFKSNKNCQKIAKVEGVGPITATAVIAAIGDPKVFKNGRHFSAFLGLVPRQSSSGGKERLLGVSKRGDIYLRTLLIHGGRTVVKYIGSKEDRRSIWVRQIKERRGTNRAAVAVANKNARIIWALLAKEEEYKHAA
jgi:transposase